MTQTVIIIVCIVLAGAFGGFVDGMMLPKSYAVRIPRLVRVDNRAGDRRRQVGAPRNIELGSLGDALVGMTASLAFLAIAESFFGLSFANLEAEPRHYLRAIALGVISGYLGIRAINPISEQIAARFVERDRARDMIREEVERRQGLAGDPDVVGAIQIASNDIGAFEHHLTEAAERDLSEEELGHLLTHLSKAESALSEALSKDSSSQRALIEQAKVLKRKAKMLVAYPEAYRQVFQDDADPERLLEHAVELLDRAIHDDPRSARALYNRACYRALLRRPFEEVRADLQAALHMNPFYRREAAKDEDFAAFQASPEFHAVVTG